LEILTPNKRGRKRRFPRDESAQASAFPQSSNAVPAAEELREDAAKKEEVKKAAATVPEIFTPENVEWAFDVYVGILSFIYSLVLKCDFKAINDELDFTKDQKESMSKPLARILSKHAPAEWAGMTDEIQLIMTLGVWTVASFQRARNVQKSLEEKKKDAERTQPVAPIRREPQREIHVPA
jgi:prophage DNA circulation protein